RFVQRSGGSETRVYAPFRGGGTPDELYFSYGLRVTFSVGGRLVPVDVYMAQGRSIARNNWWIGGNAVENIDEPLLVIIENNEITDTFKMSGGVSSFEFREV
ncbi:MAG TPA: hypothetical protein VFQ45_18210, partial [Longimicrobium sp.]|nr:hypothetical protein [Longimicrobium sp.]